MGSRVPSGLRRRVFERDGLRCVECGIRGYRVKRHNGWGYYTPIPDVFLSIDHIVPKSRGGSHAIENLRTLCTQCNTGKGTTLPGEPWQRASIPIFQAYPMTESALAKVRSELELKSGRGS